MAVISAGVMRRTARSMSAADMRPMIPPRPVVRFGPATVPITVAIAGSAIMTLPP